MMAREIPVAFKSGKAQLVGMLHLPDKTGSPCVILCHGYGGNKFGSWSRMFVKTARHFSKNGIATLRFDFFGCGDSEGDFEELTVSRQIENLGNAIDFLESVPDINKNKIGALGWSRGSAICILRAAKDKRIKSVVSWAGESDFKETWPPQYINEIKQRGYFYSRWHNTKTMYKALKDEMRHSIPRALGKMRVPFLVIHGTSDENVTLSQGMLLHKKAHNPKKVIVLKNSDHSFTGFERKVMRDTTVWFKKWLK